MNKQPEITAKTKYALVSVFCDMYMEKPIDKITIKEITSRAGYNRSTFYQYFTDVYDVLAYVEDELLAIWKSCGNINDSLFHPNLHQLLTLFENKEHYLRAVLGDYGCTHFINRIKDEIPVDELVQSCPQSEKIVPYLIEFHITTSLSLFHVWLKSGEDISADELFELIHNLYAKGISYFI